MHGCPDALRGGKALAAASGSCGVGAHALLNLSDSRTVSAHQHVLSCAQEQEFRWAMVQAAPPASASASLDWHQSSSTGGSSRDAKGRQESMQDILTRMRATLGDAVANVQRLYDK